MLAIPMRLRYLAPDPCPPRANRGRAPRGRDLAWSSSRASPRRVRRGTLRSSTPLDVTYVTVCVYVSRPARPRAHAIHVGRDRYGLVDAPWEIANPTPQRRSRVREARSRERSIAHALRGPHRPTPNLGPGVLRGSRDSTHRLGVSADRQTRPDPARDSHRAWRAWRAADTNVRRRGSPKPRAEGDRPRGPDHEPTTDRVTRPNPSTRPARLRG